MHRGLKEYFRGHLHQSPVQNPQRIAVSAPTESGVYMRIHIIFCNNFY